MPPIVRNGPIRPVPSRAPSTLVGDRWSMLIIRDAMDGARTFTDFQKRTGIARNMLADRLRRLAAYGLIAQVDAPPAKRKHYELTAAGEELFPVILALRGWGERHAFAAGEAHSTLVDAAGERVVRICAPRRRRCAADQWEHPRREVSASCLRDEVGPVGPWVRALGRCSAVSDRVERRTCPWTMKR